MYTSLQVGLICKLDLDIIIVISGLASCFGMATLKWLHDQLVWKITIFMFSLIFFTTEITYVSIWKVKTKCYYPVNFYDQKIIDCEWDPLGHEKKKRKKPCFTGRQTFEVGWVGWPGHFCKFFFLSGGKNDSPKMLKFPQNLEFFGEEFWKKIFSYFQILLANFSLTLTKKADFTFF